MTATAPCTSASKLLIRNVARLIRTSILPINPMAYTHSLILTSLAAAKGIEPLSSGSEPDILSLYTTRPFQKGQSPFYLLYLLAIPLAV